MEKRTLVVGASPNESRFSNKAVRMLQVYGHPVIPIGIRKGKINNLEIITDKVNFENIDTVSLYIGPQNQPEYYRYIISLHPKRIIFNPGTENPEFYEMAKKNNIDTVENCTLVMLNSGIF
jgi:predicted CoA-binding protein